MWNILLRHTNINYDDEKIELKQEARVKPQTTKYLVAQKICL
jgi:hypothetical protein